MMTKWKSHTRPRPVVQRWSYYGGCAQISARRLGVEPNIGYGERYSSTQNF